MTDTETQRQRAVIYEVNLTVPKARQQELLQWLPPHVEEMLALPGFTGADTMQHDDSQSPEKFSCTVHYHLDSEQSLQQYFERFAEKMRASGIALFEQDLQATRRVLKPHGALSVEHASLPAVIDPKNRHNETPSTCMDCASSLQGDFCHTCGQRRQRRLVSVFSLIAEFFDGMFNWDSRFWRTMKPLLFKPGHLTEAYLNGQRERYIPPVRMYLITSVVFFLLIALAPQKMLQGDGEITFDDLQMELGDETFDEDPAY